MADIKKNAKQGNMVRGQALWRTSRKDWELGIWPGQRTGSAGEAGSVVKPGSAIEAGSVVEAGSASEAVN
jgi:hypothetical protein